MHASQTLQRKSGSIGGNGRQRQRYWKRPMPNYRCDMLDMCGDIVLPTDIVADSLRATILKASRIQYARNRLSSPSRLIHAFEIWSENGREFPE